MALSTTSTALAFKAALFAALQADTDLTGASPPWQISTVYPGSTLQNQSIYFGKTTAANALPVIASAARVKRQEDYIVEIHIDVSSGMADTLTAEQSALGALGEIDNLLSNTASAGIIATANAGGANTTGVWKAYVQTWELRPFLDDARQGWAVILTAHISVTARLG
jgi:hypothetical protein